MEEEAEVPAEDLEEEVEASDEYLAEEEEENSGEVSTEEIERFLAISDIWSDIVLGKLSLPEAKKMFAQYLRPVARKRRVRVRARRRRA